ncbi:hypothetical protein D9757_007057 [Collybiopsis confluens]|uniref:Transmembrane protein n=1 Tax=Collybiopsis confluens TaxID=2823264 RepID=A0A8H5HCD9_9AGAR|nr:hypothetical protein D9757_007057 [Collybiopsis confluens]
MASTLASSSSAASSSSFSEEPHPQAGPLPLKRGEIGFREELVKESEEESSNSPSSRPERHPADRDAPTAASPAPAASATAASVETSSTNSLKKRKPLLSVLKRKKWGGIQLGTILLFSFQGTLILGTIAAWAVAGIFLTGKTQQHNDGGNDSKSGSTMSTSSSTIFVHVVFAVGFLSQCLFLERRVYVMRAQRYAFLHPGELLPTSRRGQPVDSTVAFSPWNRPPLPTYAAALAQSGVGTGDVEDNLIALNPPPAYGNTRGSTLLLSGFLNARLRAERPLSVRTEMSQQDRPLSYASNGSEWEIIQNAERAMRLEETLSNLERRRSSGS